MIAENRLNLSDTDLERPSGGVKALLPWVLGGSFLAVYLVTLNHWISFSNLPLVARVSGWTWQPEIWPFAQPQPAPVYWLLTYPLRWLPTPMIPLALNVLSVLLAALCLALLARSVSLLPHDRTHAQRIREKDEFALLSTGLAWLPPLLAVIVCGLQLTFWEHATAASQDMLNLFLFAYIIRALLEFRIDGKQAWLSRAAFFYGLGITNDWAFIAFFPIFIAAIVWIKGLGFFDMSFLGRMSLWGVMGLLFYLLLPATQSFSKITPVPFWTALKANVGGQKFVLGLVFNKQVLFHLDKPLWVLGLGSLLPLLAMSVRWPSYFGDTSRLGIAIASFTFHLVHAILLALCLWIALDPPTSPRAYIPENFRSLLPMLTFYYLGALAVGYFSGYFLLVFGKKVERQRHRSEWPNLSGNLTRVVAIVVLCVVTALLLIRNLHQIRVTNGPALKEFAELLQHSLPKTGGIVLSDDPTRLILAQEIAAQENLSDRYFFLDSGSLKWFDYHRFVERQHPQRWRQKLPKGTGRGTFDDAAVLQLIVSLSESNLLYYLHPSFGYYFEHFYAEPHGLVYQLHHYPAGALIAPGLAADVIDENERFWKQVDTTALNSFKAVLPRAAGLRKSPNWLDKIFAGAHLAPERNRDILALGSFYSRAINTWGVEMQKQNKLIEAQSHFERAIELNPENVVARINLECNRNLQSGRDPATQLPRSIEDQFGKYRKWDQIMSANGPFDQPNFCFEQGRFLARAGLFRQAAQQFERTIALLPTDVPSRLMLAQMYVLNQMPDSALKLLDEIHALPPALSLNRSNQTDLLYVEMSLHLAKGDVHGAETVFENTLNRFPGDQELLGIATQVFMSSGQFTNALAVIDRQLQLTPTNTSVLVNKAYALMQFRDYERAAEVLTKALALEPGHPSALFNRAICYLQLNKLEDAERAYEQLQKSYPTAHQIYYGLAEIALRKKDTNSAIRNYELYLTNSPPGNEEANVVRSRLGELTTSPR